MDLGYSKARSSSITLYLSRLATVAVLYCFCRVLQHLIHQTRVEEPNLTGYQTRHSCRPPVRQHYDDDDCSSFYPLVDVGT